MKQYHIITCTDINEMERFINRCGGVGFCVNTQKQNVINLAWDILADLSKVKKGDYIFLHSKGLIVGVFEVTSDPVVIYDEFQTLNLKSDYDQILRNFNLEDYCWWIPFKPVENLQFNPIHMDYVFSMIAEGKLKSLPQRLRYEDKNKIVKTITPEDFSELIKLFMSVSFQTKYPIKNFIYRREAKHLIFDIFHEEYEKNLEAVVCYRLSRNRFRITVDRNNNFLFSNNYVLNTVPLGYLKMADILTWEYYNKKAVNVTIWELKKDYMNWASIKEETIKIIKRSKFIRSFLNTNFDIVNAIFVSRDYNENVFRNLKNQIFPIGNIDTLYLINFEVDSHKKVKFYLKAKFGGPA